MNTMIMKIISLSIFKKAIAYKSGSLILLSIPLSFTLGEIIKIMIKDVELYDIVLPILVLVSGMALYTLFFIVDFWSGMMASRAEHKAKIKRGEVKKGSDWVKSHKLYNSFSKIGGIMLINTMMLFVTLLLVITQHTTAALVGLMFGSVFNILGCLFEFHSIGENTKRRTGEKPAYYLFFDKMTNALEEIIIKRMHRWFAPKESVYSEEENYNEDNFGN